MKKKDQGAFRPIRGRASARFWGRDPRGKYKAPGFESMWAYKINGSLSPGRRNSKGLARLIAGEGTLAVACSGIEVGGKIRDETELSLPWKPHPNKIKLISLGFTVNV